MATVVKRPEGHKIIDQAITAEITDSSGDALVTFPYHGLGTGDHVYITSDIDEYNGFWYVTSIDANSFKISEHSSSDFVEYFQDLSIDYYQTQEHDWNSIFLPIVYKCSNDRWPVNSVDAELTISSFSDDNGYTTIIPSGTIKAGMSPLGYVKISNSADEDLNSVWQLIETDSVITINLPYDASNALVGASIQYYYNNFQVKVKVYGGLDPSHPWTSKKPFEELAELSLTPDENNEVMFSVSDYIKSKVAIKNNTTIFSFPLNLDAFTGFYISVAESYDDSDGYTVTTNESAFAADDFQGYAVAGKLPFKNVYSGDYADYVFTPGSPALWLTLMSRLLAVEDKYFDVSFIKNVVGDFTLTIVKYISDYATDTEYVTYTDQGIGVYRLPIEVNSVYDSFCISVTTIESAGTPGVTTPITLPALSSGVNVGTGTSWTLGANPSVSLTATGVLEAVQSKRWAQSYAFTPGYTYEFTPNVDYNNDSIVSFLRFQVLDSSNNILVEESVSLPAGTGSETGPISFVAPFGAVKYAYFFEFVNGSGTNTNQVDIDSLTATETTPGSPAVEPEVITEEICIDILESCEAQGGFTPEDVRLLEDGDFRLLE